MPIEFYRSRDLMRELDLHSSSDHRVTSFRHEDASRGVVVTFTSRGNRTLDGYGFGGRFILEEGFDLVAVKAERDNWHQDLPVAALLSITAHLDGTGRGGIRRIGYGSSMGAYAAIKFSRRLRLDRVVALSPQFGIGLEWEPRFQAEQDDIVMPVDVDDLWPGCTYFIVTDPYDIDGLHLKALRNVLSEDQLAVVAVPFAGHPVAPLLNTANVLKGFVRGLLQNEFPTLDRALIRAARTQTEGYLASVAYHCVTRKKYRWAERIAREASTRWRTAGFSTLRSHALQGLGRLDDATETAREAVRSAPENVHFLKRYCNLLRAKGRLREAVPELEAAVAIMPAETIDALLEAALASPFPPTSGTAAHSALLANHAMHAGSS